MQKFIRLVVIGLLCYTIPASSFGQWVESYYDCICYSGNKAECLKKIENEAPDFRDTDSNSPEHPDLWLSQVRAAALILDERSRSRSEESECLEKAKTQIGYALVFAIGEKREKSGGNHILLRGLYNLGREIYNWAELNCFNQLSPPTETFHSSLPNPIFCRKKY